MQLQDYIKIMMLDFINKRSKKLNFETFENFYSLQLIQKLWQPRSIKLVQLLLKIYDQRRPLDILVQDVMISTNIAFEGASD